jgi:hypothetical protein
MEDRSPKLGGPQSDQMAALVQTASHSGTTTLAPHVAVQLVNVAEHGAAHLACRSGRLERRGERCQGAFPRPSRQQCSWVQRSNRRERRAPTLDQQIDTIVVFPLNPRMSTEESVVV